MVNLIHWLLKRKSQKIPILAVHKEDLEAQDARLDWKHFGLHHYIRIKDGPSLFTYF